MGGGVGTHINAAQAGFLPAPEHAKLSISEPLALGPAVPPSKSSSFWLHVRIRLVIRFSNSRSLPRKMHPDDPIKTEHPPPRCSHHLSLF